VLVKGDDILGMSIIHSIILGAVQGLSELLPISSSGHLILIPYFFHWAYQGKAFDIALHMGTALALIAFFWHDWLSIIKRAFSKPKNVLVDIDPDIKPYPSNLLWQILVASIPAAIVGLTINKYAEQIFQSPLLIAINLIVFGFLLWYIDRKAKADLKPGALTYGKSFLIGLSQMIALIPGVSRSGITITVSRLVGLKREEAARFSFLLATPVIVGAFLVEIPKLTGEALTLSFWLGVIAATVFGFIAIKFLLNYLKKSDFSLFLWYRVVLALTTMAVFLYR
jgi:undecaprenyl-diphosphatase